MIDTILGKLTGAQDLTQEEMQGAIEQVMEGRLRPEQVGLLLSSLAFKGETVDEIAGAAAALRRFMTPIRTSRTGVLDTCGTGGDGSATFNISTAAALVTAAAGVPVAKHGNRRVTSRTGSADVLRTLGVNIEAAVPQIERCLDELGICFCFAPLLHGAMKHVAPIRQQLGIRTIFNLLGPLTNPAGAAHQLLGVGQSELRPKLAEVLARLGTAGSAVVSGRDGLDEVTLAAPTDVCQVGRGTPLEYVWRPEDFGIATQPLSAIVVDGPEQSAAIIAEVLAGSPGPARDIVVVNAAAALWVAGAESQLPAAAQRAEAAIDSGQARTLLDRLIELSHR